MITEDRLFHAHFRKLSQYMYIRTKSRFSKIALCTAKIWSSFIHQMPLKLQLYKKNNQHSEYSSHDHLLFLIQLSFRKKKNPVTICHKI